MVGADVVEQVFPARSPGLGANVPGPPDARAAEPGDGGVLFPQRVLRELGRARWYRSVRQAPNAPPSLSQTLSQTLFLKLSQTLT